MFADPRLLSAEPNLDAFLAYAADAAPVFAAARPLFARHHRDGEVFAAAIAAAGDAVLAKAATADTERAEASAATSVQAGVLAEAVALARAARRYATFVASELARAGGDPRDGQRLLTALGVGNRAPLHRQSGVRRALVALREGLTQVEDVLAAWPPPRDLGADTARLLPGLDQAVRDQSREALEADLAQDALDAAVAAAITQFNRGLRLIAAYREVAPVELVARFVALENDHPGAFNRRAAGGAPTEPDAEPVEVEA